MSAKPTQEQRERSASVYYKWADADTMDEIVDAIAQALADEAERARASEREACAKIAEDAEGDWLRAEESAHKVGEAAAKWTYGTKADAAAKIRNTIRARSEGGKS